MSDSNDALFEHAEIWGEVVLVLEKNDRFAIRHYSPIMISWINTINNYYGDPQHGSMARCEKDLLASMILFGTNSLPGFPERSLKCFAVSDILAYSDVTFSERFDGKDVRVQLCISDDDPVETERFDVDELKKQLDSLPKDLEDRTFPDSVRKKVLLLQKVINNGGVVERALLGRFISMPTPTIYLYMGNIRAENDPLSALGATFFHEIFHAWNYFRSGERNRTIPELDEAMVEAATLYLLNEFQLQSPHFGTWCPGMLEWDLESLRKKRDEFGLSAAYGYGSFLYENVDDLPLLLSRYSSLSGILSSDSTHMKDIRKSLYPFYPYKEEKWVLAVIRESLA